MIAVNEYEKRENLLRYQIQKTAQDKQVAGQLRSLVKKVEL